MSNREDVHRIKEALTLDFNQAGKRRVYEMKPQHLITPDLDKLALSTPDLDLLASRMLADTKATNDLPTYSRHYDDNTQVFAEALLSMQTATVNQKTQPTVTTNTTTSGMPAVEAPPTLSAPASNLRPVSLGKPVNLENQEELKLQRKRFRNRLAATKCRQKKLERIQQLERRKTLLAKQKESQLEMITHIERLMALCNEHLGHHGKMGCVIVPRSPPR